MEVPGEGMVAIVQGLQDAGLTVTVTDARQFDHGGNPRNYGQQCQNLTSSRSSGVQTSPSPSRSSAQICSAPYNNYQGSQNTNLGPKPHVPPYFNHHSQVNHMNGQMGHMHGQMGHMHDQMGHVNGQMGHVNGQMGHVNGQMGHVNGQVNQRQLSPVSPVRQRNHQSLLSQLPPNLNSRGQDSSEFRQHNSSLGIPGLPSSHPTLTPVREVTPVQLRSSLIWTDRGPSIGQRPSRGKDTFAESLRKYPNSAERTTSADLIQRLLAYTQSKNLNKNSSQSRSLRSLRHSHELNESPVRKSSKNIQTYTRTRQQSPTYDVGAIYGKVERRCRVSPVRSERGNMGSPSRQETVSASYDYLKIGSPRFTPRTHDIRYLNDVTRYVRDTLRSLCDDQSRVCPRIASRYSQHRRSHHRTEAGTETEREKARTYSRSTGPSPSNREPCSSRSSRLASRSGECIRHRSMQKYDEICDVCHKPLPCECTDEELREQKSTRIRFEDLCKEFVFKLCPSDEDSADEACPCPDEVCHNIDVVVDQWLREVPIYASFTIKEKQERNDIVKELKAKLKQHIDHIDTCKDDIMVCLNALPMWLPRNVEDHENFKNGLAEKLLEHLTDVVSVTSKFNKIIRKWLDSIPLKDRPPVDKNTVATDLTKRLSEIMATSDLDNQRNALKEVALEELYKLPLDVHSSKRDAFNSELAEDLVNKLLRDDFDDLIHDWLESVPLKSYPQVNKDDFANGLARKIRDIVANTDPVHRNESLFNEIVKELCNLPVDCKPAEKDILLPKLAKKLADKLSESIAKKERKDCAKENNEFGKIVSNWVKSLPLKCCPIVNKDKLAHDFTIKLKEIVAKSNPESKLDDLYSYTLEKLRKMPLDIDPHKTDSILTEIATDLVEQLAENIAKDEFDSSVRDWVNNLPLKPYPPVNKDVLGQDLIKKLKNIISDTDPDDRKDALKDALGSELEKLPIDCSPADKVKVLRELAEKLANKLADDGERDEIDRIVRDWIKSVPFKSYPPVNKIKAAKNLSKSINNIMQNTSPEHRRKAINDTVCSELSKLPIDCNPDVKAELISDLADKLAEKIIKDKFCEKVKKWVETIPLKSYPFVDKELLNSDLTKKFKDVVANNDPGRVRNALKNAALQELEKLPIKCASSEKDILLPNLATNLADSLIELKYQDTIRDWMKKVPLKSESPIDKNKFVNDLTHKLTDLATSNDPDKIRDAFKDTIYNEITKLPIDCDLSVKEGFLSDLAGDLADSLVRDQFGKTVHDWAQSVPFKNRPSIDKNKFINDLTRLLRDITSKADNNRENALIVATLGELEKCPIDGDSLTKENLAKELAKRLAELPKPKCESKFNEDDLDDIEKMALAVLKKRPEFANMTDDEIKQAIKNLAGKIQRKKEQGLTDDEIAAEINDEISDIMNYENNLDDAERMALEMLRQRPEFAKMSDEDIRKAVKSLADKIRSEKEKGLTDDKIKAELNDDVDDYINELKKENPKKFAINITDWLKDITTSITKKESEKLVEEVLEKLRRLRAEGAEEDKVNELIQQDIEKHLENLNKSKGTTMKPQTQKKLAKRFYDQMFPSIKESGTSLNKNAEHRKQKKSLSSSNSSQKMPSSSSISDKGDDSIIDEVKDWIHQIPQVTPKTKSDKKANDKFAKELTEKLTNIKSQGLDSKSFIKKIKNTIKDELESTLDDQGKSIDEKTLANVVDQLVKVLTLDKSISATSFYTSSTKPENLLEKAIKGDIQDWVEDCPELKGKTATERKTNRQLVDNLSKKIAEVQSQGLDDKTMKRQIKEEIKDILESEFERKEIDIDSKIKNKLVSKLLNKLEDTFDRIESVSSTTSKQSNESIKNNAPLQNEITYLVEGIPELIPKSPSKRKGNEKLSINLTDKLNNLQSQGLDDKQIKKNLSSVINIQLDSAFEGKGKRVDPDIKNSFTGKLLSKLDETMDEVDSATTTSTDKLDSTKAIKCEIKEWVEEIPELKSKTPTERKENEKMTQNLASKINDIKYQNLEDREIREIMRELVKKDLEKLLKDKGQYLSMKKQLKLANNLLDRVEKAVEKVSSIVSFAGEPEKIPKLAKVLYDDVKDWANGIPELKANNTTDRKSNKKMVRSLSKKLSDLQNQDLDDQKKRKQMLSEIKDKLDKALEQREATVDSKTKDELADKLLETTLSSIRRIESNLSIIKIKPDILNSDILSDPNKISIPTKPFLKAVTDWMENIPQLKSNNSVEIKQNKKICESLAKKLANLKEKDIENKDTSSKMIREINDTLDTALKYKGEYIDKKTRDGLAEKLLKKFADSSKLEKNVNNALESTIKAFLEDVPELYSTSILEKNNLEKLGHFLGQKLKTIRASDIQLPDVKEQVMKDIKAYIVKAFDTKGEPCDSKTIEKLAKKLLTDFTNAINTTEQDFENAVSLKSKEYHKSDKQLIDLKTDKPEDYKGKETVLEGIKIDLDEAQHNGIKKEDYQKLQKQLTALEKKELEDHKAKEAVLADIKNELDAALKTRNEFIEMKAKNQLAEKLIDKVDVIAKDPERMEVALKQDLKEALADIPALAPANSSDKKEIENICNNLAQTLKELDSKDLQQEDVKKQILDEIKDQLKIAFERKGEPLDSKTKRKLAEKLFDTVTASVEKTAKDLLPNVIGQTISHWLGNTPELAGHTAAQKAIKEKMSLALSKKMTTLQNKGLGDQTIQERMLTEIRDQLDAALGQVGDELSSNAKDKLAGTLLSEIMIASKGSDNLDDNQADKILQEKVRDVLENIPEVAPSTAEERKTVDKVSKQIAKEFKKINPEDMSNEENKIYLLSDIKDKLESAFDESGSSLSTKTKNKAAEKILDSVAETVRAGKPIAQHSVMKTEDYQKLQKQLTALEKKELEDHKAKEAVLADIKNELDTALKTRNEFIEMKAKNQLAEKLIDKVDVIAKDPERMEVALKQDLKEALADIPALAPANSSDKKEIENICTNLAQTLKELDSKDLQQEDVKKQILDEIKDQLKIAFERKGEPLDSKTKRKLAEKLFDTVTASVEKTEKDLLPNVIGQTISHWLGNTPELAGHTAAQKAIKEKMSQALSKKMTTLQNKGLADQTIQKRMLTEIRDQLDAAMSQVGDEISSNAKDKLAGTLLSEIMIASKGSDNLDDNQADKILQGKVRDVLENIPEVASSTAEERKIVDKVSKQIVKELKKNNPEDLSNEENKIYLLSDIKDKLESAFDESGSSLSTKTKNKAAEKILDSVAETVRAGKPIAQHSVMKTEDYQKLQKQLTALEKKELEDHKAKEAVLADIKNELDAALKTRNEFIEMKAKNQLAEKLIDKVDVIAKDPERMEVALKQDLKEALADIPALAPANSSDKKEIENICTNLAQTLKELDSKDLQQEDVKKQILDEIKDQLKIAFERKGEPLDSKTKRKLAEKLFDTVTASVDKTEKDLLPNVIGQTISHWLGNTPELAGHTAAQKAIKEKMSQALSKKMTTLQNKGLADQTIQKRMLTEIRDQLDAALSQVGDEISSNAKDKLAGTLLSEIMIASKGSDNLDDNQADKILQGKVRDVLENIPEVASSTAEERKIVDKVSKQIVKELKKNNPEDLSNEENKIYLLSDIKDKLESAFDESGSSLSTKTKNKAAEKILDSVAETVRAGKPIAQHSVMKTEDYQKLQKQLTALEKKELEDHKAKEAVLADIKNELDTALKTRNEFIEMKAKNQLAEKLIDKVDVIAKDPERMEVALKQDLKEALADITALAPANSSDKKEIENICNNLAQTLKELDSKDLQQEDVKKQILDEIKDQLKIAFERKGEPLDSKTKRKLAEKLFDTVTASVEKTEKDLLPNVIGQTISHWLGNTPELAGHTAAHKAIKEKMSQALTKKMTTLQNKGLADQTIQKRMLTEIKDQLDAALSQVGDEISSNAKDKLAGTLLSEIMIASKGGDNLDDNQADKILQGKVKNVLENIPEVASSTAEERKIVDKVSKQIVKELKKNNPEDLSNKENKIYLLSDIKDKLESAFDESGSSLSTETKNKAAEKILDSVTETVRAGKPIAQHSVMKAEDYQKLQKQLTALEKEELEDHQAKEAVLADIKNELVTALKTRDEFIEMKAKNQLAEKLINKVDVIAKDPERMEVALEQDLKEALADVPALAPAISNDKKEIDNISKNVAKTLKELDSNGLQQEDVKKQILDEIKDQLKIAYERKGEPLDSKSKRKLAEKLFDTVAASVEKTEKDLLPNVIGQTISHWFDNTPELAGNTAAQKLIKAKMNQALSKKMSALRNKGLGDQTIQERMLTEIRDQLDTVLAQEGDELSSKAKDKLAGSLLSNIMIASKGSNKPDNKQVQKVIQKKVKDVLEIIPEQAPSKSEERKTIDKVQKNINLEYLSNKENKKDLLSDIKDKFESAFEETVLPLDTSTKSKAAEKILDDLADITQNEVINLEDDYQKLQKQLPALEMKEVEDNKTNEAILKDIKQELVEPKLITGAQLEKTLREEVKDVLLTVPELKPITAADKKVLDKVTKNIAKDLKKADSEDLQNRQNRSKVLLDIKDHVEAAFDEKSKPIKVKTKNIIADKILETVEDTIETAEEQRQPKPFLEDVNNWLENIPELTSLNNTEKKKIRKLSRTIARRLSDLESKGDNNMKEKIESEIKEGLDKALEAKGEYIEPDMKDKLTEKLMDILFKSANKADKIEGSLQDTIKTFFNQLPALSDVGPSGMKKIHKISEKLAKDLKLLEIDNLRHQQIRSKILLDIKDELEQAFYATVKPLDSKTKNNLAGQLLNTIADSVKKTEKLVDLPNTFEKDIASWINEIPELASVGAYGKKENEKMCQELAKELADDVQYKGVEDVTVQKNMIKIIKNKLNQALDEKGEHFDIKTKEELAKKLLNNVVSSAKELKDNSDSKIKKKSLDNIDNLQKTEELYFQKPSGTGGLNKMERIIYDWHETIPEIASGSDQAKLKRLSRSLAKKVNEMHQSNFGETDLDTQVKTTVGDYLLSAFDKRGEILDTKTRNKLVDQLVNKLAGIPKIYLKSTSETQKVVKGWLEDIPELIPKTTSKEKVLNKMSMKLAQNINKLQLNSSGTHRQDTLNDIKNDIEFYLSKLNPHTKKVTADQLLDMIYDFALNKSDLSQEFQKEVQKWLEDIPEFTSKNTSDKRLNEKTSKNLAKKLADVQSRGIEDPEVYQEMMEEIKDQLDSVLDKKNEYIPPKMKERLVNKLLGNIISSARAVEAKKDGSHSNLLWEWFNKIPDISGGSKTENVNLVQQLNKKLQKIQNKVQDEDAKKREMEREINHWLKDVSKQKGNRLDNKTKDKLAKKLMNSVAPHKSSKNSSDDEKLSSLLSWRSNTDTTAGTNEYKKGYSSSENSSEKAHKITTKPKTSNDREFRSVIVDQRNANNNNKSISYQMNLPSNLRKGNKYVAPREQRNSSARFTNKKPEVYYLEKTNNQNNGKRSSQKSDLILAESVSVKEVSKEISPETQAKISNIIAENIHLMNTPESSEVRERILEILKSDAGLPDEEAEAVVNTIVNKAQLRAAEIGADEMDLLLLIKDAIKDFVSEYHIRKEKQAELEAYLTDLVAKKLMMADMDDKTREQILEDIQSKGELSRDQAEELFDRVMGEAQRLQSSPAISKSLNRIKSGSQDGRRSSLSLQEQTVFEKEAKKVIKDFMYENVDDPSSKQEQQINNMAKDLVENLESILIDPDIDGEDKRENMKNEIIRNLRKISFINSDKPTDKLAEDLLERLESIRLKTSTPNSKKKSQEESDSSHSNSSPSDSSTASSSRISSRKNSKQDSNQSESSKRDSAQSASSKRDSAQSPSSKRDSNSSRRGSEEKKNEDDYGKKLEKVIGGWLDSLPIDPTTLQDKEFKATIIKDLVGDIIDRQKYLQLNPDVKTTDADELDNLRYQCYRWMNKFLDDEDLNTAVSRAEELLEAIKGMKVPKLIKSSNKEQKFKLGEENNLPTYLDALQNEIRSWMDTVPSHIKPVVSDAKQKEYVKNLAENVKKHRGQPNVAQKIKKEISNFLPQVYEGLDEDELKRLGSSLFNALENKGFTDDSWVPTQDTSEFVEENLNGAILEFLKQLPLYQKASPQEKKEQELAATEMAKQLKKVLERTKSMSGPEADKVITNEIVKHLKNIVKDPELLNDEEFLKKTAEQLLNFLKGQQLFHDLTGRSNMTEVDPLSDAIDGWVSALPIDVTTADEQNKLDDLKQNFKAKLKQIRQQFHPSSPQHEAALIDEVKRFMISNITDPFKKYDEKYLDEKAKELIKTLEGVPIQSSIVGKDSRLNKNATDTLYKYIEDWFENLPIHGEAEKVQLMKKNLASKLMNKINEFNMNPDIFNDDILYEDMLVDEIEQLTEDIPRNPELDKYFPALKRDLNSKVMDARQMLRSELAGKAYKQQLRDTVSASMYVPENLSPDEQASLELLKDKLADAFINLHYSPDGEDDRARYKNKISSEVDRFCDDILRRYPCLPLDPNKIKRDLQHALVRVPAPKDDSMKSEIEQVRIRDIINEWMKQVPLRQETQTETLHRYKLATVLAKKLHDIENEASSSIGIDPRMADEITKFLKKVPLRYNQEIKIPELVHILINWLKSSEQSRKFESKRSRSMEIQADVCSKYPCTLTAAEKAHLLSIKERVNRRSCYKNMSMCSSHVKHCGSQTDYKTPYCSPPSWMPQKVCQGVKRVPSMKICQRPVSKDVSCMTTPSLCNISPRVVVKEYFWGKEDSSNMPPKCSIGIAPMPSSSQQVSQGVQFGPPETMPPKQQSYRSTQPEATPRMSQSRNKSSSVFCPYHQEHEIPCTSKPFEPKLNELSSGEESPGCSRSYWRRPCPSSMENFLSCSSKDKRRRCDDFESDWSSNLPMIFPDDFEEPCWNHRGRRIPFSMKKERTKEKKCMCKERILVSKGSKTRNQYRDMCQSCGSSCPHPSYLYFRR